MHTDASHFSGSCRRPRSGKLTHVRAADGRRCRLLGLQRVRGAGDGRHEQQIHADGGDGAVGRWARWSIYVCICQWTPLPPPPPSFHTHIFPLVYVNISWILQMLYVNTRVDILYYIYMYIAVSVTRSSPETDHMKTGYICIVECIKMFSFRRCNIRPMMDTYRVKPIEEILTTWIGTNQSY